MLWDMSDRGVPANIPRGTRGAEPISKTMKRRLQREKKRRAEAMLSGQTTVDACGVFRRDDILAKRTKRSHYPPPKLEAPTEEGDSAPPSPSNLPIRAGPPPPASQSCGQPLGELGTKMLVEQSKKRAMERRLTRLVEKFSSRLTEGLAAPLPPQAPPGDRTPRRQSGRKQETTTPAEEEVGSDFEPDSSSDESEEEATREMEAEEAAAVTSTEVKEEVEALTQEAELSQEDFLAQFLPPGYLEQRDQLIAQEVRDDQPKSLENGSTVSPKEESDLALLASGPSVQAEDLPSASSTMEEDGEWKLEDEERVEAGDEEDTLKEAEEEEKRLGEDDHEKELQELEEMMSIPVEELRAKYAGSPPSVSDDSSDSTAEDETDNETEDGDGMPDVGLEHLLEDLGGASPLRKEEKGGGSVEEAPLVGGGREIEDVAKEAESFQPKGYTLSTQKVVTPVPVLLKHQLREYQHIGLDWLVALSDRKLNGILADEMGLGKTIQTIALLAHLAEKGNWGPHLIIVPTSVMLNWEMEFKKWCPGFKLLVYYGSIKERKLKRTGWTKQNTFHVCITSYKLVVQDHSSFRRKKWKYLILDEAQNIKNFKSQRWQLLLDYQAQRRLLLTGTPLQNNLMELWSLMHFLMPHVFGSHREFKEWFDNPMSGMVQGDQEYCETIVKRLHKVLRPFILRRLKSEVEKQLPKKYEHIIPCRLSKRQRFLYEDFMSRAKTKETLASGNVMSVFNVLMQLRKVCNHPDLFEPRPILSPLRTGDGILYQTASLITRALDYDPLREVDWTWWNICQRERSSTSLASSLSQSLAQKVPPERLPQQDHDFRPKRMRWCYAPFLSVMNRIPEIRRIPVSFAFATAHRLPRMHYDKWRKEQLGQQLQQYSEEPRPDDTEHLLVLDPGRPSEGSSPFVMASRTLRQEALQDAAKRKWADIVSALYNARQERRICEADEEQSPSDSEGKRSPETQEEFSLLIKRRRTDGPPLAPGPLGPLQVDDPSALTSRLQAARAFQCRLQALRSAPEFLLPCLGQDTVACVRRLAADAIPTDTQSPSAQCCDNSFLQSYSRLRCAARSSRYRRGFRSRVGEQEARSLRFPQESSPDRGDEEALLMTHPVFLSTLALEEMVPGPEEVLQRLKEVTERFVMVIPAVKSPTAELIVSHPSCRARLSHRRLLEAAEAHLKPRAAFLHSLGLSMALVFPELRLIQYDCGKLQALDGLLRRLKLDDHRVLIFTQMTKMLDVLEAFLNYHGHRYLRLDGTTKVEQRQALMERFNADKRIFVFILSTRSGGLGVNLTGADTVIFYDSDWNPTMDAQAQDRCHRIGQTRDVHIYRLISVATVEENILKKAQQKRALGNLAIEEGQFTTEFFKQNQQQFVASKQNTIQDLFEVATGQASAAPSNGTVGEDLSKMLAAAEEEEDVRAAQVAQAEAQQELAEFDENIPLMSEVDEEIAKKENEFRSFLSELSPVELYAYRWLDTQDAAWKEQQLASVEEEMEAQRQEWEQRHAQAMEEMRTKQEEDEQKEKPAPESSRRGRRRCQSSSSSSTESEEQEEDSSDDEEEDETSGSDDEGSPIPPPAVPKPRPRLVEKNAQSKAVGRVLPRRPPIKLSPAKPIHRRLVLRAKRRTAASAWRQRTQPSHARSRAPAPDNSKREERLLRRKRLLRAEQGASPEKRARREERSPAHGKRTSLVAPESAGGSDSSETPAPRTRAKIKVDIDLWKLDDSGALPGIGSSGSSKGGGGPGSSKGGGPESSKGGGPQGLAVVREPGKERKSASGNGKDNAKPRARRFRRNTISGGLPKVNGEV